MTAILRMRRVVAITGVALLTLAFACAEAPRQTQVSPSASTLTFTLTNSDCTAEGLTGVLQKTFAVALVNTTSSKAAFNLHRLQDGRTYREFELHIQARQQSIAAGSDTPGLPPMTIPWASVFVEPAQRGKLESALIPGTYGFVCRRDSPDGHTAEAIYVKGPFQVN